MRRNVVPHDAPLIAADSSSSGLIWSTALYETRYDTAMRYESHRGNAAGSAILFLKRRVLMPALRWLFEYSRDNFERQRRVNQVLFACVQELAVETAHLRREVQRQSAARGVPAPPDA